MTHYKKLLLIFMIVLTIPSVFSVQSTPQVSPSDQSLNIEYIKTPAFPVNTPFKIHVHLYNSTGSQYFLKDKEYCTIHVYNFTNGHIVESNMTLDSNNVDYFYNFSSGLSEIGEYPYVLYCDTVSDQDGFVSDTIKVTTDGKINEDSSSYIAVALILIGVIALLFKFAGSLEGEKEWIQPMKLLIYLLGLFMILLTLGYGLQILKYATLLTGSVVNIVGYMLFAGIFLVFPVIMIFLVWLTYDVLKFWDSLRGKKGGGWNK